LYILLLCNIRCQSHHILHHIMRSSEMTLLLCQSERRATWTVILPRVKCKNKGEGYTLLKLRRFPLFVHTCTHRQAGNSSAINSLEKTKGRRGRNARKQQYTWRRVNRDREMKLTRGGRQIFRLFEKLHLPRWRWSKWPIIAYVSSRASSLL